MEFRIAAGSWQAEDSIPLHWCPGDTWEATMQLPRGSLHQYKYVVMEGDPPEPAMWQAGINATLAIDMDTSELEVHDHW